jgi:hypothetical protein
MLQRRPDLPRHMAGSPDNPMDRLPIAIRGYTIQKVINCFCRRRSIRKQPFDCSSLRSEQVALTSFGPLPHWWFDPTNFILR